MKIVFTRVFPAVLSAAVCFSVFNARAGENVPGQQAAQTVAAIAVKYASPAAEMPAEQTVAAKIKQTTAESTQTQKVHAAAAETVGTAPSAAQAESAVTAVQTAYLSDDEEVVTLFDFIGKFTEAFFKGMRNLSSGVFDLGGKFPEFANIYRDSSGKTQYIKIGMYYDKVNKLIIGKANQGAFGIGFDVDLKQKMMYATRNIWARSVGYSPLYDAVAPALGIDFKTERIKFDYDGLDWMVQIWKGKYFTALSGAEMGIYNKPKDRVIEFYDCIGNDDMLEMSMQLLKGDQVIFKREAQKHWWMNGFALSNITNKPSDLTLKGNILFKDGKMMRSFLSSFDKVCKKEGISYTVKGRLVSYIW